jgi:hypothetical protein
MNAGADATAWSAVEPGGKNVRVYFSANQSDHITVWNW